MLVDHADAGGERRRRIARRQRLPERRDRPLVRHVVAEQDRHQRRLAGAVLAEQRQHLAARQVERHGVVRDERAEALGDARQRENGTGDGRFQGLALRRLAPGYSVDLGSASLTLTVNLPSWIAFSLSFTFFTRSAGTFFSNVPSGANSEPLYFIVEYGP